MDQSSEETELTRDNVEQFSDARHQSRYQRRDSPSPIPEIDTKLTNQYHYAVEDLQQSEDRRASVGSRSSNGFGSAFPSTAPDGDDLKYHVSMMREGYRVRPRFTLSPDTCSGFVSLVQHIQSTTDTGQAIRSIQIHGPHGLVDVVDQTSWMEAIELIKQIEWMDGEVKCVVQMEDI